MTDPAQTTESAWQCGPHTNVWKGHDARCRRVPVEACVHCGDVVADVDYWWVHARITPDGNLQTGKARCQSASVAYGHLGHPARVPCPADGPNPCLGARAYPPDMSPDGSAS